MSDYRRSYWKTVVAAAFGAMSAALVLVFVWRAVSAGDQWTFAAQAALWVLAASALAAFAFTLLVSLGGLVCLRRDALEERGITYAPSRARERSRRPLRRAGRNILGRFSHDHRHPLVFEAGDEVQVRPLEEILETLDENGMCDGLPFMPEMARFCGQRFRVFRRVDKLNDWVDHTGLRRARNTVLLEGLHCDGTAHGGCEAQCHIRWKEAWLVRAGNAHAVRGHDAPRIAGGARKAPTRLDLDVLARRAGDDGGARYICQVTELAKGTTPLHTADPRHYVSDWWRGNVRLAPLLVGVGIGAFNWVQRKRGGVGFPVITPRRDPVASDARLDAVAGELVQVRTKRDIEQTLTDRFRCRGLWFDAEMLRYCGGVYRVASRVQRVIEERTGRMIDLRSPCIILDGVRASAEYQAFGAQHEAIFWREAWLTRPERAEETSPRPRPQEPA